MGGDGGDGGSHGNGDGCWVVLLLLVILAAEPKKRDLPSLVELLNMVVGGINIHSGGLGVGIGGCIADVVIAMVVLMVVVGVVLGLVVDIVIGDLVTGVMAVFGMVGDSCCGCWIDPGP